jgi:hypothetical protein
MAADPESRHRLEYCRGMVTRIRPGEAGRATLVAEPTLVLPPSEVRTGLEQTLVLPADEARPGTEQTMLAKGSTPGTEQTMVAEGSARESRPRTELTMFAKGGEPGVTAKAVTATEVERYVVLDEIGRGGLGRVVRAKDRKLERTVAIKQLHQNDLGTERRFMGEALVTARQQDPSIVPIHDTGRTTTSRSTR